jgi:hypothetical protein
MPYIDLTLIGLPSVRSKPRVTDSEASTLYKLWNSSPPGQPISAKRSEVRNLISKGLLQSKGDSTRFALTPDGREVIADMVTTTPNKFKVGAEMPSYKEIKQRALRAKQTFIKRAMKAIKEADLDPGFSEEEMQTSLEQSSDLEDISDDAQFDETLKGLLRCLKQKRVCLENLQGLNNIIKSLVDSSQVTQQDPSVSTVASSENVLVKVAGF